MPLAVIFSAGDLNLQPIKELLDNSNVTYTECDASSQVSKAQNILLSEVLGKIDDNYNCVFIKGVGWQEIILDTTKEQILLVYSLPETYLIQKAKEKKLNSLDHYVDAWKQHAFHCLQATGEMTSPTLLSLNDLIYNATSFMQSTFGKGSKSEMYLEVDFATKLLDIGVKASLLDRDDLYELYDELLSNSKLFGNFSVHLSPDINIFKQEANSLLELASVYKENTLKVVQLKNELADKSVNIENLRQELNSHLQLSENVLKENQELAEQKLISVEAEFESILSKRLEELKEAELNTFQLQEELEASFSENESLKQCVRHSKQELEAQDAKYKLDLAKSNEDWSNKVKLRESENEKLLKELVNVKQQNTENLKQAELQVFQVQEELEGTFLELQTLKKKINSLVGSDDLESFVRTIENDKLLLEEKISLLNSDFKQQSEQQSIMAGEVKEELELATLQITQLQEELEFYYLQALEISTPQGKDMHKSIICRSFSAVSASSVKIVGQYSTEGYQDLHLVLENVDYPHCGLIDRINVKLVVNSGKVGIEFRTEGNPDNLFTIEDDCVDEYGAYLRYFPEPPEFLLEKQDKINQRLNTNDRLLVFCTLNCIQKAFMEDQTNNDFGLENRILKDWKLRLSELRFREHYPMNWLSFDEVAIKESFAMDSYEHLWLQFTNLLSGDILRRSLEVKLCAKGIVEEDNKFFASFFLEFRSNTDTSAPLFAWPPEDSDEYGPKLEIDLLEDLSSYSLANEDSRLITLIKDNLQSILLKTETKSANLSRSVDSWCNALSTEHAVEHQVEHLEKNLESEESSPEQINASLSVEEVIDLDSYQHIVFGVKDSALRIKLRAENINHETLDAEVYLELRDGTRDVIYNTTEYFDIDEYGPRVRIPAEILEHQLITSEGERDLKWAENCYQSLNSIIETSEKVDELLKIMWSRLIERKKQK